MDRTEFIRKCFLSVGSCFLLKEAWANENSVNTGSKIKLPMHPAKFWTETPRGIKCLLCPNECVLKAGDTGNCHNRRSIDNKLYSIAYGNPCAVHLDPIEKKPLFHFHPGSHTFSLATAGCNLACLNCQNFTISQTGPDSTNNIDLQPREVIEESKRQKSNIISFTYTEPLTCYEYLFDTAQLAKQEQMKIVLVSAGYINEAPLKELAPLIHAANIDLKSFDEDTYLKLNGGQLKTILRTLEILRDNNVWLEITNLVIPRWTDDLSMIRRMCVWLFNNGFANFPLHFSRFHPMYKLTNLPPTSSRLLIDARKIAIDSGLNYVYIGNLPTEEGENTYCPECKKILVERYGFRIIQNNITKGKCKYCNKEIHGIWD